MTKERYLWDKSGPEDPFVAKLERLLRSRRRKVQRAGWPGGTRIRILRLVGSVVTAVAAAAAVMVCLCLGSDQRAAAAPGTEEVAPPVAVETVPEGAGTDAGDALEEAEDGAREAQEGLEKALGEHSCATATPAALR